HVAGEPVMARAPLLGVRALDQGAWGNRLRVAISDNDPPLARSQIRGTPPDSLHLRLSSANGVEAGTILKRVDSTGTVLSVHKVVGATWALGAPAPVDDDTPPNALRKSDRRSEGASWLVRVHDEETVAANKLAPRLGPAPLVDVLPGGRTRPARLRLVRGDDA